MKMLTSVLVGVLLFSGTARAGKFTDNQNGVVTDNVTGLFWQQQDDQTYRNWETAITYCENLNLNNHTDWRLPNIKELDSLVDRSRWDPAIDPVFPITRNTIYGWVQFWSSTTHVSYGSAWYVNFETGGIGTASKSSIATYVRCVRGGQ